MSVGAHDIADAQGLPLQYAQQILHRLKKGALVKSVRGPRGGYRLARSPQEISLKAILDATEGDTFKVICDADPIYHDCGKGEMACTLRGVWSGLKGVIDGYLEQRMLSELVTPEGKGVQLTRIQPQRTTAGKAEQFIGSTKALSEQ